MQLAVDANILIGELLRKRGRWLLAQDTFKLYVTEKAWDETQYELRRRTAAIAQRYGLSAEQQQQLVDSAVDFGAGVLELMPTTDIKDYLPEATIRIPRFPTDAGTVALALCVGADIWTNDNDFLGCGVATWTTETLLLQLGS